MFGKLLLIMVATVGGIYLSAPEGKSARLALLKRKAAFTPLIRELLTEAKAVLEGAREVDSVTLRANLEKVVSEVKVSLNAIDFDATINAVRDAIRLTARKLREAEAELARAQNKAFKDAPRTAKKQLAKPLVNSRSITISRTRAASPNKDQSGR